MQTLTPQEEGACVGTEMSGGQPLPSCRTSNLNPPCLTSRRSQPPLALAVPLSRFTSRVGGGSAFFVRRLPIWVAVLKHCQHGFAAVFVYMPCRVAHPRLTPNHPPRATWCGWIDVDFLLAAERACHRSQPSNKSLKTTRIGAFSFPLRFFGLHRF